jgi:predicted CoA-substrate-specific enzyme activase
MNDKCAAGTGRFYEGICRLLNVDMPGISELSAKAANVCQITSQCTVFAESEIISLLAHKFPPADVAAGIQHSVAKRCLTFLKGVGIIEKVTMTGGCAKNKGLIMALEELGHIKITPLSIDPQLMGCLGAATIARRKGMYLAQNK